MQNIYKTKEITAEVSFCTLRIIIWSILQTSCQQGGLCIKTSPTV